MDKLHSSEQSPDSTLSRQEVKIEVPMYRSESNSNSSAKNDEGNYSTQIRFAPVEIKEEVNEGDKKLPSTISFHSGTLPVLGSEIKNNSHSILGSEVPLVSQGVQLSTSGNILVNANDNIQKVIPNHHSLVSVGQGVNFTSSLNISNSVNHGTSIVPVSCSQNSDSNQPVQMFHSSSFDGCEGVLNQQQQQHSGQAFLLASPGTVLSSNQLVSQGQVFLQGDELVGVTLATSSANSSGYSITNSESQYASSVPVVLSGSQAIGNTIPRLIIQSSQPGSTSINNQILPSNTGHYIIQVGQSVPPITQNNNFSISNKGHIVIKSGGTKIKNESENYSAPKDGVFRVVIPEGTTKLPRFSNQPVIPQGNIDDSVRKHVQINLSNRASLPSPSKTFDTAVQTSKEAEKEEKFTPTPSRKFYECLTCKSKFMRSLYLRMHLRVCKKNSEVVAEKMPLFMCSFCKATFKNKANITVHLDKCLQNPYNIKDEPGKRKAEENSENTTSKKKKLKSNASPTNTSLGMAVLFKCQDCDRTFSKQRQYTSHIKKCTQFSVHDLSGAKVDPLGINIPEEDHENPEDPFADPPLPTPQVKKGRGGGGRRGRPPGKVTKEAQKGSPKNNILFDGEKVHGSINSLIVADDDNLVRSTAGLAHTVQLSVESAKLEGLPMPRALIADSKGVRGMNKPPYAWSLICSLCQKMFLTKPALANHIIDNHGTELRTTRNILLGNHTEECQFKCPFCHLYYQSNTNFVEHLVIHHTNELQDQYKTLQSQVPTYVCSLCSLVLLTKNLLMEHLSLEHLDHLEKVQLASKYNRRKKNIIVTQTSTTNGDINDNVNSCDEPDSREFKDEVKNEFPLEITSEGGVLQCNLCSEEFVSSDLLVRHYSQAHSVQLDSDGNVVDEGIDVDIRVKNTKQLIQIADGKSLDGNSLPEKTVLIRKKPRQSWQCQHCLVIFTKQMSWLRHIRESCPNAISSTNGDSSKPSTSRESHFFCHEPECARIAFYQVKSLFKHMTSVHGIVIPKERKTFASLYAFNEWLTEEEDSKNLRFIRDNTRLEKGNVRLIQMVCHRFHAIKLEHSKEKEEWDATKPTKKRWSSRVSNKANNCHARIHLRVEFNSSSKNFDGETQVIYYPKHFHYGEEDTQEILERVRENYPRDKNLGPSVKSSTSNSCLIEGDSGSSFSLDSTSDILQLQTDENSSDGQPQQVKILRPSQRDNNTAVTPMQVASMVVAHSSSPTLMISQGNPTRSTVIFDGGGDGNGKELLLASNEETPFIVMNSEQHRSNDNGQEFGEEYVLPADDNEWMKLFDVLASKLSSGELTEEEVKEGTALLAYKNIIAVSSVSEQVSIFQRMCTLTNTSLESE